MPLSHNVARAMGRNHLAARLATCTAASTSRVARPDALARAPERGDAVRCFAKAASKEKSPEASTPMRKLLREHLHDALYSPRTGYFTSESAKETPVGFMREGAIDFRRLRGQDDYFAELNRRYAQLGAQWLTPGEIFAPHYSTAVAKYVLEQHRGDVEDDEALEELRVYEIGGGSGTFASGFLDAVRREAPKVYAKMRYTSLDISKRLNDAQGARVRLGGHGNGVHRTSTGDATNPNTWGPVDNRGCFVIALEVLDNLPHDRVWRPKRGDGEWMQTEITRDPESGALSERTAPLEDELIKETIRAIEMTADLAVDGDGGAYQPRGILHSIKSTLGALMSKRDETWFVPTGAMRLFETLHAKRPNHRLIAADFDSLPNVRIDGVNAPLVASQREGGRTDDHASYLLPESLTGSADVFFPTCFQTLRAIDFVTSSRNVQRSNARLSSIVTTRQFMSEYADIQETTTGSGYNPLLQDFTNTKFLLSRDGGDHHHHDDDESHS